jgi:DNA (cytosine-5)-methyltransferase 1
LAADYGSPQLRERLVIIGTRTTQDLEFPISTHLKEAHVTIGTALENLLDEKPEYNQFSASILQYLKLVPEGGNWKSLPASKQKSAMGGAYFSGGGKVGFYRRLSFSKPSPTLVTSPNQKATLLAHPTEDRPLSIKEYARIQEFPDDWKFEGKLTDRYKQIGNAVPISLGKAIAETISLLLKNRRGGG